MDRFKELLYLLTLLITTTVVVWVVIRYHDAQSDVVARSATLMGIAGGVAGTILVAVIVRRFRKQ